MEVIVKNSQLSKTHINKMAYNPINNILACNIDGNDTILFFTLDSQSMIFVELFKGMSKPPGSKISMTWSPDGKYLALGAGYVQLWELKDGRLKPVKSYQEDFIEIKIIEWSVDSQSYVCGGISRTNTIKIRNIETGKVKQIQLPERQTISAISFDPYGKYLLLLLRNNTIQIYSVVNYEKYKSVRLSPEGLKINPIKEVRTPSWSPDFSNFVCPSLDDSRMNVAINLSRTRDFKTKNIFVGHCTSISCCKFNPKLYRWNGEVTAIVAMGDSAGNVSFWRVGSKHEYSEPLLLSNSLQNSMQVVEDIEWDEKGDILMVNMMKKYVHLIKFVDKAKCFGVQLSNDQTFSLIRQIYGSNRATDVNNREIEVFNFSNFNSATIQQEQKKSNQIQQIPQEKTEKYNHVIQPVEIEQIRNTQINTQKQEIRMEIEEQQKPLQSNLVMQTLPTNLIIQTQPINSEIRQPTPVLTRTFQSSALQATMIGQSSKQYVRLSQQKVIFGKNNKKKIQPAMMVRKDEMTQAMKKPYLNSFGFGQSTNNQSNTMFFSNSMVQTFPSLQLPPITFGQRQISLNKRKLLEIRRLNKVTSLQIFDLSQDNQYIARRIFPSIVDYVRSSQNFIYVLNQQFLYIFDLELNPKELPLKVGPVHQFFASNDGEVYFINCEGYLIGFDHVRNINKTLAPVPLHLLLKQNFQSEQNSSQKFTIKEFLMTKTSDIFITIESEVANTKNKRQRFLYDTRKNGWVKLDYKEGVLQSGFSIRITDSEQNMVKNFFSSLCPSLRQRALGKEGSNLVKQRNIVGNGVVFAEQEQMIFYQKYQKNIDKFNNSLIGYLNSLKSSNKNKQLRNAVNKYFFDQKSLSFIRNASQRQRLWERVKREVGGNIVEEFLLNSSTCQMIQQQ